MFLTFKTGLGRRTVLQGLVLALAVNGCAAQDPPPTAPPQTAPQNVAEATYWPAVLLATEGRIEVYQPQPESMKGNTLTARAAVSLVRPQASSQVFGTIWFTAHVITDRDTRMVTVQDVAVNDVRIPGSTPAEEHDFAISISGRLSNMEVTFPLDQLTTSLDTAKCEKNEAKQIETTPPHILFSTTPATVISINGAAKLLPVEGQPGVSRVANTPFIVLCDNSSRDYYIKAGSRWVTAKDIGGPWVDTANIPAAIGAAGEQLSTPLTSTTGPATPTAVDLSPAAATAEIIVVTEPTELVVTTGNPQFTPVPGDAGGELLYASNTASDLFLDQTDHRYYVLLSGRWYASAAFTGPWQYVPSDKLPSAFAQIPTNSPKADVLSFVAGTNQAHEAVLDASVPQTASIRRDAGTSLTVAYDGDPKFQDVPQSPGVAYALNTPEEVFRVNGRYYCCHEAVWYDSGSSAGPWVVCVSVPPAIYSLPPSCPDYNASYVYVYDYNPDYVTCGYLPGYTGTYLYGPTIVYGTGYDYPGWYGEAYFAPPCTWGFAAYYDPFACTWGFDAGLYWGFGWFAQPWHEGWWRDHPYEHRGAGRWWGPRGYVHSHDIRGQMTSARAGSASGWNNVYSRRDNIGRNATAAQTRAFTTARPADGSRDNVFAGHDGSVFRRSDSGWEQYHSAGPTWSGVDRVPEAAPEYRFAPSENYSRSFARPDAGLDQHYAARAMGGYRSATVGHFGGGGFRGGGGGGRR